MIPHPPSSTLFPYTTLFRSKLRRATRIAMVSDRSSPGRRGIQRPIWITSGRATTPAGRGDRSEEHTSELQSRFDLVCRLLLEKKKKQKNLYQINCLK